MPHMKTSIFFLFLCVAVLANLNAATTPAPRSNPSENTEGNQGTDADPALTLALDLRSVSTSLKKPTASSPQTNL